MTIKTTGADFKRFWANPEFWPKGSYWDDGVILVNGVNDPDCDFSNVDDAAEVSIINGVVLNDEISNWNDNAPTLEQHFDRWQKKQVSKILLVEVPNEHLGAVTAAIEATGGRLLK